MWDMQQKGRNEARLSARAARDRIRDVRRGTHCRHVMHADQVRAGQDRGRDRGGGGELGFALRTLLEEELPRRADEERQIGRAS